MATMARARVRCKDHIHHGYFKLIIRSQENTLAGAVEALMDCLNPSVLKKQGMTG